MATPVSKEKREKILKRLKSQQEQFAEEVILSLKFYYRLHDDKKLPKHIIYVTREIHDAILALNFIFRCHFRQIYYALKGEFRDPEEFEKYLFALPVERNKLYAFNFLFRVSFIFELCMYLFKNRRDYFHLARKCLAAYPDVLFFEAAGGWARLNEISIYIIRICKVLGKEIATEHPLIGKFIEDERITITDAEFLNQHYLWDDKDIFDPKEMYTINVLDKYFYGPRLPKSKFNLKDLAKMEEIFPIFNRVPFEIKEEPGSVSIIYDLHVETREIYLYFRSYMDPELLEKYFPLKFDKSGNLIAIPKHFACYVDASEESVSPELDDTKLSESRKNKDSEESSKFDSEKYSILREFLELKFCKETKPKDSGESSKLNAPKDSLSQDIDEEKLCQTMESLSFVMKSTEKVMKMYPDKEDIQSCKSARERAQEASIQEILQSPELALLGKFIERFKKAAGTPNGRILLTDDELTEIPQLLCRLLKKFEIDFEKST